MKLSNKEGLLPLAAVPVPPSPTPFIQTLSYRILWLNLEFISGSYTCDWNSLCDYLAMFAFDALLCMPVTLGE